MVDRCLLARWWLAAKTNHAQISTHHQRQVGLCVGIFVSIAVLLQELSEVRTSVMVPIPSAGGGYLLRSQSVDATLLESKHIKVGADGRSRLSAVRCAHKAPRPLILPPLPPRAMAQVIRLTASLFFGNQEELRNGFQELVLSGGDDIKVSSSRSNGTPCHTRIHPPIRTRPSEEDDD